MTKASVSTEFPRPTESPKLSKGTCIAWGAGTIAVAVLFNSINVLLLRYAVDFAGISASLAGALIAGSKLYDAFIDPIVGGASDRLRSKIGRRRPFLLGGGILLAISGIILFNIPSGGGALSIGVFGFGLIVYATGYASFSVPYLAMPAEMTPSYNERSKLISYRVAAVAVASLLAVFVGPVLISYFGGGRGGHSALSIFLAVVVLLATIYCFFGTRDAPFHFKSESEAILSWKDKILSLLKNGPFAILLFVKFLQLMALAVTQAATPFLFQRVLQLSDTLLGVYFLVFYATMIAAQPLWVRLCARIGKRNVFIIGSLFTACIYASWYFVSETEPFWLLLLRAFAAGGLGGALLLAGQSMLPDAMQWDYCRTGMRREGMLSAIYTVVEKVAFALGAAATGILLGSAGYIQGGGPEIMQPQRAIDAIYLLASVIPMVMLLISGIALMFYDLNEEKLAAAER